MIAVVEWPNHHCGDDLVTVHNQWQQVNSAMAELCREHKCRWCRHLSCRHHRHDKCRCWHSGVDIVITPVDEVLLSSTCWNDLEMDVSIDIENWTRIQLVAGGGKHLEHQKEEVFFLCHRLQEGGCGEVNPSIWKQMVQENAWHIWRTKNAKRTNIYGNGSFFAGRQADSLTSVASYDSSAMSSVTIRCQKSYCIPCQQRYVKITSKHKD